jgi:hypothetical protein
VNKITEHPAMLKPMRHNRRQGFIFLEYNIMVSGNQE